MPNWCEGKLKLRGKYNNIVRFLNEGINLYEPDTSDPKREYKKVPKGEVSGDTWQLYIPKEVQNRLCYVEDTRRGFVYYEPDYLVVELDKEKEHYGIILQYQQAWSIDTEDLLKIAQKYELDLKIEAYECGMEFGVMVEIVDGVIKKDESLTYNDWFWDCPNPFCGG